MKRGRRRQPAGPDLRRENVAALRVRIAAVGMRKKDLAMRAGLRPQVLGSLLSGRVPLAADIERRLHAVLGVEERAQAAAEAVRRREDERPVAQSGSGSGGASVVEFPSAASEARR